MVSAESWQDSQFGGALLSVEWRRLGDSIVIEVDGELDVSTAPQLRDCLTSVIASRGDAEIALDMSAVSFVDWSGWSPVVDAGRKLAVGGERLIIVEGSAAVQRLVELVGVDEGIDLGGRRSHPPSVTA